MVRVPFRRFHAAPPTHGATPRGELGMLGPMPATARLRRSSAALALGAVTGVVACNQAENVAREGAREQVLALAAAAAADAAELRQGLPEGAKLLPELLPASPGDDPEGVRVALERTRARRADLSGAKATFFAFARPDGRVVRSDREVDLLAGQSLSEHFPGLTAAVTGACVEARGSHPALAGVKGAPDAQWVLACGVGAEGSRSGLYAAGWSWSSYAYRLEWKARSDARERAAEKGRNAPLLYAFVVVGAAVYAAPVTPEVNRDLVRRQGLAERVAGTEPLVELLDTPGRVFALGARRVPELGPDVLVAVLRSET